MAYDIPIIYIVYKRLDKTKESFERIRSIQPSKLYIIADGFKNESDKEKVLAVRNYLDSNIDWPCEVHKRYYTKNMGLRYGIPSGISYAFEHEEMAIIIEDDVVPELSFFNFCEQMLHKYKDNSQVMMISGFNIYEDDSLFGDYDITFSCFSAIWGWATWKRAWKMYKPNIPDWRLVRNNTFHRLSLNKNGFRALKLIFDDLQFHWYNSWGYQWQFTVLNNGLGIVPQKNLITNTGINDIEGEHPGDSTTKENLITNTLHHKYEKNYVFKTPEFTERNIKYDKVFQNNFYPNISFAKYIKNEIRAFINELSMQQIQKLENDQFYFNNILEEKYKLNEEELLLNPGSKYKQISAKELRKSAFAYWKWALFSKKISNK